MARIVIVGHILRFGDGTITGYQVAEDCGKYSVLSSGGQLGTSAVADLTSAALAKVFCEGSWLPLVYFSTQIAAVKYLATVLTRLPVFQTLYTCDAAGGRSIPAVDEIQQLYDMPLEQFLRGKRR